MKKGLTYLFPVLFLLFLLKSTFSVDFAGDLKAASGPLLSKAHSLSAKIFDKETTKKYNRDGFSKDFTDDDIQFSDSSLITFFAGAAVLLGLALHFLYREKSLSPFTLILLNRNVSRRYILLENLRL